MEQTLEFPELAPVTRLPASDLPPTVKPRNALLVIDPKELVKARFGDWRTEAAALVEQYRDVVYDQSTSAGEKALAAAIADVREPRFKAAKIDDGMPAELKLIRGAVTAEKDAVVAFLAPTEKHLVDQQTAHREKKRIAAEAEAARVAADEARKRVHTDAIAKLISYATMAVVDGYPADRLRKGIDYVTAYDVSADVFEEYAEAAARAKAETITKLTDLHTKAVADERMRAEHERQQRVIAALAEIQRLTMECLGQPAAFIGERVELMAVTVYSEEVGAQVVTAHEAALLQLRSMLTMAQSNEALQAQMAAIQAQQAVAQVVAAAEDVNEAEAPSEPEPVATVTKITPATVLDLPADADDLAPAAQPQVRDPDPFLQPLVRRSAPAQFAPAPADGAPTPTLNLGAIGEKLGFSLPRVFIEGVLGVPAAAQVKAAVLWHQADLRTIYRKLGEHVAALEAAL